MLVLVLRVYRVYKGYKVLQVHKAHKELKVNKAATLNLFTVVAGTGDAPAAPTKGKRAKREQVTAE